MKNDNMLNESTIRRFMKLATIGSLSEQFVEDNLKEEEEEDLEESTEEVEEGYDAPMARDEEEEEMGPEMEMDEEEGEMEMDMDMEMDAEEPAAGAGGMVSVDQLMSALESALEDVLGQEVEVSQDDEEEMDMDADAEMDMGADAEMDLGADAEMDMDAEEEEEDLEEGSPKTDVVEQVYARVVQRLTKETKSNKK